jgi:hypothetical protein
MRYTSIEMVSGSPPYITFRNVATTSHTKNINHFQHLHVEELPDDILYYKGHSKLLPLRSDGFVHIFLLPETHPWFNFCVLFVDVNSISYNAETVIGDNITSIVKINLRMLDILNNITKQL